MSKKVDFLRIIRYDEWRDEHFVDEVHDPIVCAHIRPQYLSLIKEQRRYLSGVAAPLPRMLSTVANSHAATRDAEHMSVALRNEAGALASGSDPWPIPRQSLRQRGPSAVPDR